MIQGKNRRLANVKTRRETGLDYVMFSLDLNTPFGKKQLKEVRPYYPGEEAELRDELDRVEQMIAFVKQNQILTDKIQEVFMEVKDATLTIERSGSVTLSTVELFEIKTLLLQMRQLRKLTMEHEIGDYQSAHCCCAAETSADSAASEARAADVPAARAEGEAAVDTVPEEYFLADTEALLDELDPRRDRMNTFYIYNEFSPLLEEYRTKKKEYEQQIRREQKQAREELRKKYWDARHNVFAYIIEENGIMRYSDDGEPAGTAGLPVLDCIKKEGLSNIAVVVTRYFGGILLGTGGLVHAYSKAAKEGIAAALPVDMALCTEVSLFCDYTLLGKIQNELCRGNVLTGDTVYTDSVKVCAFVPVSDTENFVKNMTDKTNGQVRIEIGKTGYKKYI